MTACLRLRVLTVSANASASAGSGRHGIPLLTAQKRHPLVHTSPRIINEAVPNAKHSPALGQHAPSQTVCKRPFAKTSSISSITPAKGAATVNQLGRKAFASRPSEANNRSTSGEGGRISHWKSAHISSMILFFTSEILIERFSSSASEVICTPDRPQGTIVLKWDKFGLTLRAKPWIVTQ